MAVCLFGPTCHLMAQPTLRITSPTEGAVVNAGQALNVTVEASAANAFEQVIIISPLGFSQVLAQPPYKFTLPIPLNITPRRSGYSITADGIGARAGHEFGAGRYHVERPDIPASLIIGDSYLNSGEYSFHVDARLSIPASFESRMGGNVVRAGIFPDRKQVDLTESSYLKYSTDNPRVAKVDNRGTVLATGIGSAKITVTYRNKSAIVPVTVGEEPLALVR